MSSPTRQTRLRAERGANRAAIIAAAETALRERPFREVSVDEVMQAAGLARTQFYRHFDDLSDLVLKVAGAAFESLLASYSELTEISAADTRDLRAAVAAAVDTFIEHGPLVRAISEAASYDALVQESFDATQEAFIELTEQLVRRAKRAGAPVGDPAQTARLLHMANVTYLIDAFGSEPKVQRRVAIDTIARVWTAVLGPA